MASYLMVCALLVLSILLIIPFTESSRCAKKCVFQEFLLNSTIPSDFCPSSNSSDDDNNKTCVVEFKINFNTGIVSGEFYFMKRPPWVEDELSVETSFYLKNTSVIVEISYVCSVSDYCDLEFVRQTLSPALGALEMERFRQTLATRFYSSSNTAPIECSNQGLCPQNMPFCNAEYLRRNATYNGLETVKTRCINSTQLSAVHWVHLYTPYTSQGRMNLGSFDCNIPNCASNATIIETSHWLTREYIFPVNASVLNVTTIPPPTTTTTTTFSSTTYTISTTESTVSTTTSNDASSLSQRLTIVIPCFMIILLLH